MRSLTLVATLTDGEVIKQDLAVPQEVVGKRLQQLAVQVATEAGKSGIIQILGDLVVVIPPHRIQKIQINIPRLLIAGDGTLRPA